MNQEVVSYALLMAMEVSLEADPSPFESGDHYSHR